MDGTGTVIAIPTSGGQVVSFSTRVWAVIAGPGHKLLFNDRFRTVMQHDLTDLKSVDAAGGSPTVIATDIDDDVFTSNDKSKVVFSVSQRTPTSQNGVYAA